MFIAVSIHPETEKPCPITTNEGRDLMTWETIEEARDGIKEVPIYNFREIIILDLDLGE